jgi:SAM-dependent methyltransferase
MEGPSSLADALERLQLTLDAQLRPRPQVLEAGCGSSSLVQLPADATIVGLDISSRQLERNTTIHERVQGDVQTHRFPASSFDLIVCWDVLEHLPEPKNALNRLVEALAPGGLLVLGFPNALSLKGLLTKLAPFRLHVGAYRRLIGSHRPAEDGRGPFPTYMRLAIAPSRLANALTSDGLQIVQFDTYESPLQATVKARFRIVRLLWPTVRAIVKALTVGRVTADETDVILVAQANSRATAKPSASAADVGT